MEIHCPLNDKATKADLRRLARLMVHAVAVIGPELRGPSANAVELRRSLFVKCLAHLERLSDYQRRTKHEFFQAEFQRSGNRWLLSASDWRNWAEYERPADWPVELVVWHRD